MSSKTEETREKAYGAKVRELNGDAASEAATHRALYQALAIVQPTVLLAAGLAGALIDISSTS